eukprot:CAMPEP_0174265406 /NCGR_PEP_ID=MMETSP0439-20130205/26376_1 /TAXON_ID=0 /ORGANISM="Stereomyxa ramosa, Strain Chinc5" /LENGTH=681 /DNA_ID=CAMNT_0015351845 /DNA_START=426 /DNA_END=2471 /DNA_ORIENTATION=+
MKSLQRHRAARELLEVELERNVATPRSSFLGIGDTSHENLQRGKERKAEQERMAGKQQERQRERIRTILDTRLPKRRRAPHEHMRYVKRKTVEHDQVILESSVLEMREIKRKRVNLEDEEEEEEEDTYLQPQTPTHFSLNSPLRAHWEWATTLQGKFEDILAQVDQDFSKGHLVEEAVENHMEALFRHEGAMKEQMRAHREWVSTLQDKVEDIFGQLEEEEMVEEDTEETDFEEEELMRSHNNHQRAVQDNLKVHSPSFGAWHTQSGDLVGHTDTYMEQLEFEDCIHLPPAPVLYSSANEQMRQEKLDTHGEWGSPVDSRGSVCESKERMYCPMGVRDDARLEQDAMRAHSDHERAVQEQLKAHRRWGRAQQGRIEKTTVLGDSYRSSQGESSAPPSQTSLPSVQKHGSEATEKHLEKWLKEISVEGSQTRQPDAKQTAKERTYQENEYHKPGTKQQLQESEEMAIPQSYRFTSGCPQTQPFVALDNQQPLRDLEHQRSLNQQLLHENWCLKKQLKEKEELIRHFKEEQREKAAQQMRDFLAKQRAASQQLLQENWILKEQLMEQKQTTQALKRENDRHRQEKQEILDKLERLENGEGISLMSSTELKQLKKKMSSKMAEVEKCLKQRKRDTKLCVACMDNKKEVVFFPCGHCAVCLACNNKIGVCPLCMRSIEHRTKLFV